jgi:diguanylate cyclase (GGDEF)-like protein
MRPAPYRCVLLLLLPLAGGAALALDPQRDPAQYQLRTWTTLDGLPSDTVSHVLELADGQLLLSSYYAPPTLFDGVTFRPLHDRAGRPLASATAVAAQTADGSLWLGSRDEGLLRRHPDGRGERVALPGADAARLGERAVQALLVDGEHALLIGTGFGLFRLDWQADGNRAEALGLAGEDVVCLLRDQAGTLWAGTERGLRRQDADGQWQPVAGAGLEGVRIWALHQDRRGQLWVGTRGRGLLRFDGQAWHSYDSRSGFPYDVVRRIDQDAQGTIWAATAGAGLVRVRGGRFDRLGAREGLGADTVWWTLFDRSGVLWAGTAGGGFTRVADSPFLNWSPQQGLASGFHWGIYRAADGSVYFAGNNGISRLRDGRMEVLGAAGPGSATVTYSFIEDAAGRLLVGTQGGLFQLGTDDRLRPLAGVDPPVVVRSLFRDGDTLWVGGGGLYRLLGERLVADPSPLLQDTSVHRMGRSNGALWFASGRGLVWREAGADRLLAGPELGLVRDVWQDATGSLWLAARGLWWKTGAGAPQPVPPPAGERAVQLHTLAADRHGGLWASTNQGLLRYAIDELLRYSRHGGEPPQPRRLNRHDGLVSSELNGGSQNAVLRDADGSLWYPAASGVSRLLPDTLARAAPSLRAAVIHLEANGIGLPVDGLPELPAGTRRVAVGFTALPAAHGPRALFRYRLLPGDARWTDAGRERQALLAGLGPGEYRFEVEAYLPDQREVSDRQRLLFRIQPAWWERDALRIPAILGGLALLLALPLLHIRALRAQRRQLLAAVEEKTRALERLARTDPLTGLPNRRAFDPQLDAAWAADAAAPLALLALDIDYFKPYNDHAGHPAGDRCLVQVARVLQRCARHPSDLVARIGGEEFAVLLPDTSREAARLVAERIRDELAAVAIAHPASPLGGRVTVSIGLATRQPGMASADALTAAADEALYAAKRGGRDRVAEAPADGDAGVVR